MERQRDKDQLEILKAENAKKAKKLKKSKLQNQLEALKTENAKKSKSLKPKRGKIIFDNFIKNTLKNIMNLNLRRKVYGM